MKNQPKITRPETKVSITIKSMRDDIKQRQEVLRWILKHEHIFSELPFEAKFYGGQVDFDNLTHDKIRLVLKTFKAGKWVKTPMDGGKVNYETQLDGMRIRCWAGDPPPNCRIVEEVVHIPARTEIVKRLVCPKSTLRPA
jgi:hypothetical protein